jgi:hypothetical protein
MRKNPMFPLWYDYFGEGIQTYLSQSAEIEQNDPTFVLNNSPNGIVLNAGKVPV